MKGAVNVISIVLISGIIITLVGAAYTWSIPLITKSQSQTTFQTATSFVLNLDEQIKDVTNVGGGEGSIDIPQGMGFLTLVPYDAFDARNNSLLFDVVIQQPLALNESVTYLGGASFVDVVNTTTGTFGEASPGIVSFRMQPLGTGYKGTFQILYRKLVTKTAPVKGFKIALRGPGPQPLSGSSKVTFSYGGTAQDPSDPQTRLTFIDVRVV